MTKEIATKRFPNLVVKDKSLQIQGEPTRRRAELTEESQVCGRAGLNIQFLLWSQVYFENKEQGSLAWHSGSQL